MARIGGQTFQPMSCACVIQQGIFRDGEDWETVTVVPENIVRHCDASEHQAITDPEALSAAIRLENRPLAQAVNAIRGAAYLLSYYIDADRAVHVRVRGASSELQDTLEAIDNLIPHYVD